MAIVIPLPSSESNVLRWLPIECCLILPVARCPLAVDPFADILRTIFELRAVGLGERKKLRCVTVDETHIFEINSERARFLSKHIPEGMHMFTAEPSTYEQHDKAVSGIESIYSETHRLHRVTISSHMSRVLLENCKHSSTSQVHDTKGEMGKGDFADSANRANSVNCAVSVEFGCVLDEFELMLVDA